MEEKQKKSKLKAAVIILSILLALSLISLAAVTIYNRLSQSSPATVTVPENLIDSGGKAQDKNSGKPNDEKGKGSGGSGTDVYQSSAAHGAGKIVPAASLSLYKTKPSDNTPFSVQNMYPGDLETKYFCVSVTHKNTVTVRYHADIRPGGQKLAEVLKVKIQLLNSGETLYDGLMKKMPAALKHKLSGGDEKKTDKLYYKITAYLDTSVGNEYEYKKLIADFRWWSEDAERLSAPGTGDNISLALLISAAGCSLLLLIVLLLKRREEEQHER